jgi:twinkle protein
MSALKLPELPKEFSALKDRNISADTARKYQVTNNLGEGPVKHQYPYFDAISGEYVACKLRSKDKKFAWRGDYKSAGLFGQHLFAPGSAKSITIVEGECDAMASYQIQGSRYPCVSVKSASVAVSDCVSSYKYLDSFDEIVIVFDRDEGKFNPVTNETRYVGQEAAESVAKLFAIGKVRVVTLAEHKDSNDYLIHGKGKEYMKEWWGAPTYTPSGLVAAKDMWDQLKEPRKNDSISYPWHLIQKLTYGIRLSELVTLTAETGVGKTSVLKEIQHHILQEVPDVGIGILHLEEPNDDTALGLMSITANKPLHLPDVREHIETVELREYFDLTLNNDRVIMWDHFGSNQIDTVIATIRYMHNMGCKYIFLDHLSILVSDQNGDERKQLDEATTKLKTLCMELRIAVVAVIHQNRDGKIRGTAGVEQLSNIVIKMTRDIENKDNFIRNVTVLNVQKNRFCGRTGPGGYVFYEGETGRLRELTDEEIARYEGNAAPVEQFKFQQKPPTGEIKEEDWTDDS